MEDLPIDIHSNKLLDWLISRRHCQKEWQKAAYTIREKINHAIQDMPENESIVALLSGTYINYFHCKKIVEILKETEKDSKNIFGSYSSQRMKDWQEVIKLYEKDNVHLAESAQILQRLIQYEVPSIKKQITKCQTSQQECEKKEKEYEKLAKESLRHYKQECAKWGVGDSRTAKIRTEVRRLAADLPAFFDSIASKSRRVMDAKEFYEGFREYLMGKKQSSDKKSNLLPTLSFLLAKGNVTFYQWKTGKVPERVESSRSDLIEDEETKEDDEIDFGDEADIDFGIDEVAEIDYGEFEVVQEQGIDSIENSSDNSSAEGGVARGDEALSLLEHSKSQRLFMQDLKELEAFLRIRLLDLKTTNHSDFLLAGSLGSGNLSQKARSAAMTGASEVENYLATVQGIMAELNDPYKKNLFKIRVSESYLTKITEQIEQKRALVDRNERSAELMRFRQGEFGEEGLQLGPKLEALVKKTKELQKQVEEEISQRYKGRRVNIMGGISAVISAK